MKTVALAVLAAATLGLAVPALAGPGCATSTHQSTQAEKPKAPVENPST